MPIFFTYLAALAYLIYYYVRKILPVLLITSIFLVLIGMLIKIGTKAGYAILIVLLSGMALLYILYGNKALDLFKNLGIKIKNYFIDFKPITSMFKNDENQLNTSNDTNDTNDTQ